MLNFYKPHTLVRFTADVFMCERCRTGSELTYWNLRLLKMGKLIEAFHWDDREYPMLEYKPNDGILVLGRWSSQDKNHFQVIQSKIVTSFAANDDDYHQKNPMQLEFDFGDSSSDSMEGS